MKKNSLTIDKLRTISQAACNLAQASEMRYYNYIKRVANEYNLSYEQLLLNIRQLSIDNNYRYSKENTKHYHATSLEGFETIINCGKLLSRKERKKLGISTDNLGFSSSENVQFSRDYFDSNGKLIKSGYASGRGATGTDITFVFGNGIFNEPSFDASFHYPTVESLDIKESCVAIIVKDEITLKKVSELLKRYELDEISIFLNKDWDINISLEKLENMKKEKQKASINIDYVIGSDGEVYKVDNMPSLHNMTIEERVNYAKSVISNYSVGSAEYEYYNAIINQNIQRKSNDETVIEDKFNKLTNTYKKEKSFQEKWTEYIRSDEHNIEIPKRTSKELLMSIKEKMRNRKQLDEEEKKLYESLNQINKNDKPNFYTEKFAGVDPNELEWYFSEMKNIEMSGDLNSRRIR